MEGVDKRDFGSALDPGPRGGLVLWDSALADRHPSVWHELDIRLPGAQPAVIGRDIHPVTRISALAPTHRRSASIHSELSRSARAYAAGAPFISRLHRSRWIQRSRASAPWDLWPQRTRQSAGARTNHAKPICGTTLLDLIRVRTQPALLS
jgi:hypothetical protein